jgi:ketosteroid isomerase-like protein
MNSEASNKELMLSVFAAFRDGNLAPLFDAVSPDVVWTSSAPQQFFRFGGTHRGLSGMKEYTALLFSRYTFIRFEPMNVTARGEQVWGLFDAEALHQPSGKYVKTEISIRWSVRDGKVVEHQGFFDTAGVLLQQGDVIAGQAVKI